MELPRLDPMLAEAAPDDPPAGGRRPLRAGPSPRGFAIGIYLEHLEEASFLYEQRLALLEDPGLTWRDLGEFEDRLEAHVDALVLGGNLASEVCRQQATEGDAGETHAAARVACRHGRWGDVEAFIAAIDPDDGDRWTALEDALAHEAPSEWAGPLGRVAGAAGPAAAMAARAIGRRRLPAGDALVSALEASPDQALAAAAVVALGRLRHRQGLTAILNGPLRGADQALGIDAALAALRMGEGSVVPFGLSRPGWAARVAALGGGPTAARRLLDVAGGAARDDDHALALGLLGDAGAVPALLSSMSDEERAESAALGLHVLTGAELFEEVAMPAEAEEPIEIEEEDLPVPEPAPPPPPVIRRISRDVAAWTAWWEERRPGFQDGVRYRMGLPATPAASLAMLTADYMPRPARRAAADELAVRYACPVDVDVDSFVREQLRALAGVERWMGTAAVEPGAWYLAGRRMSV